jgi:hypothetical protein
MFSTRLELVELIPSSSSLALTLLAPRRPGRHAGAVHPRAFPHVYVDLILADDPACGAPGAGRPRRAEFTFRVR